MFDIDIRNDPKINKYPVYSILLLDFFNQPIENLFPKKDRIKESFEYLSDLESQFSWITVDEIGIGDKNKVRFLFKHPMRNECPDGLLKKLCMMGSFYVKNDNYKEDCNETYKVLDIPLWQFLMFAEYKCNKPNPYQKIYKKDDQEYENNYSRKMNLGDALYYYSETNPNKEKLMLLWNILFQLKAPLLEEEAYYLHTHGYMI